MTDPEQHIEQQLEKIWAELSKSKKSQSDRAWDIATKLMVPLVISIVGWGIMHEVRVSNLELTRMSRDEGHIMRAAILKDVPPQWLRDSLAEIKQLLKENEQRLRALEARVK